MTQTASRLLLPLVIATPLIAGLGLYINRQLSEEIRQETYRTLTIIAEQKRQQIESKLDEARGDAELFFRGPALLPTLLDEWLRSGRKDAVLLNRMHDRLEQIVQARGWLGVAVYGTDNRPVVSVGTTGLRPRPESIQSGPRPAQVEFLDLSRNAAGEAVYGLLAPVSLPDRKAVGVALPEWSAEQTLYPLVEAWPAPTLSAETFLVRLEGEEVFYLTPLRHEADAAMTKRESIHRAGLPAALAALGERGILADARDYRGVPVLAYATAIAGTPWLMIAKIDQDEAQAGLRRVAWITTLVTGMTLLLLYGAGYLLWRRERQRRELEELTARKAVEARFRVIFEQAPLGVALIDSLSGRILEVNPRFAEIAGRNQEELTRLDWMSITHPEDVPADRDNMARLNAGLIPGFRMEKRYLKPDGGVVWINMTIAPLASEPGRPSRHLCMIEDITERRAEQESLIQAREQLARADSDRQFRILFAQSLDGILILTDDQRILDANSAALDLLGYPPDELRLLRLSDILADAEQPRLTQSPPVMMAGMPHHEEWLYRRKDGSTFLGEVTAKRLVEGRYFARFQDVTERRRLEKQETIRLETLSLLASGASLPNILESLVRVIESSHAGLLCSILLLDQEGTHLLTGAAPSLPDFYNRAIHGLAIGPAEGSCGAAAFTGQRVIVEDIQTHPNWVNFRQLAARAGLGACWSEPIRSATGQVCGTFAIYHRHPSRPSPADLQLIEQAANLAAIAVDRTRAIEALSASEERYRLLAENANDIIWTMDLQGGFVYMSPAVEKYLGYSPAEAIQLTLDQLLTPTSAESVRRELARVFAAIQTGQGGTEISQELHAQCKDGSKVWIDVATTVMRNPQGEVVGIVGVARDITARKFTEIRLSESEQRFRSLFEHLPIAY
ncbi:MAG: PAS domain S-box protein, partial [Methylococcus sp.]